MITIEAAAPDPGVATRLAAAAVAVLESQSSRSDTAYSSPITTGGGAAPKFQRFFVEQVAPIRVNRVVQAALPIKRVGAPLFLFGLWCAGVVFLPWLLRRRPRRAAATIG
jgi:hypothetical protein